MICEICPRNCKINREKAIGVCGASDQIVINKIMLHHFEEPIISGCDGKKGSGAIFFSGCNLKCVFCQNYEISHSIIGKSYTIDEFIEIIRQLEKDGAYNINLVTPTHYSREIIEALKIYKPKIPVVWNSGGYEKAEIIKETKGLVDIYLVDLKYMDNNLALRYSKANNYVENATKVIMQMRENEPQDIVENGLMKKGVIVRHLVLPNCTNDSVKCLEFVANSLGKDTIVSIMSQFEPSKVPNEYQELKRKITPLEYKRVVNKALELGLKNAYTQDLTSANKIYTPEFNTKN